MPKTYRSRLQRKESKRLMRQGILLFVITIGIVAALIIWGIPALVRVLGLWGEVRSSSESIASNDTSAPIPPRLSIAYEATNSAQIAISGIAEPGSSVTLINNGNEQSQTLADNNGLFNFNDVSLDSGENAFTATAADSAGNKSQISQTVMITYDSESPTLDIKEPSTGAQYYGPLQQTITIKGTTDPDAQVKVNDNFAFVGSQGEFSYRLNLNSGDNQVMIIATDPAGNTTTKELTLAYSQ